jgi:hypothetical protein
MAFSIKGFAVLLLLTILASFGSSTPLATTTALVSINKHSSGSVTFSHNFQALRDCIPVEGEWGCAPFGQTTSALDTKSTSAAILERDDTTLECDSMIAPFSKSGVRIDFVEPFCDRIDDVALRQSSVDENPISNSIQMYLYVGTQSANWVSSARLKSDCEQC